MDNPKTDEQWRVALTPEQFRVLREHGTERAWTSPLNDEHRDGIFSCAGCGQPLFKAGTKFDSGTGWPSFFVPLEGAVETTTPLGVLGAVVVPSGLVATTVKRRKSASSAVWIV